MSTTAWCDLNAKCDTIKTTDICPNHKRFCQKQITFTENQIHLEGAGFKRKIEKKN